MPKVSDLWLRKILAVLYRNRRTTRTDIVQETGLNVASVSLAVQHLISGGVVQKHGDIGSKVGRKREELKLNSEAGYFLAVDLEGTRIRFGLTNFLGDVRFRWEEPLVFRRKLEMDVFAKGVDAAMASLQPAERSRVIAMGVSYPGTTDQEGRVTAVNLGWIDFPLAESIRETVDLPAFLAHECRTKLLAERWLGAARGVDNCLYVTVANGVGLAGMVNGCTLLGKDGNAGELGHITIEPEARDRCNCGRSGCLESIASSPNIVRQYLEKLGKGRARLMGDRVQEVFDRAREGDETALAVLDRACNALGMALAHVVSVLNPELIILGGDLIHAGDLVAPRIERQIHRNVLPRVVAGLRIQPSLMGFDIGLVGAASLAFHESLKDAALLHKMCRFSAHARPKRKKSGRRTREAATVPAAQTN